MEKERIAVIIGPTAAGKSRLALSIALALDCEIVCSDSMQVYRYLNIGTDKPSPEERRKVTHHMIDIIDPDEDFNAGMYMEKARRVIKNINERGKRAIVVGGTGLYVKALTRGIFNGPGKDEGLRKNLLNVEKKWGLNYLYNKLKEVDPEISSRIHPNDRIRIVRALEVYYKTEIPLSEWQKTHSFKEKPYDVFKIGLNIERGELYRRIEKRVEDMIDNGLVEEVDCLLKRGYSPYLKSMQALGYKEICQFLMGNISKDEAIYSIKRNTKRYAKRQFTWFRKEQDIRWFNNEPPYNLLVKELKRFFKYGLI